ncbi:DUF2948 family protein [Chelativorans sp. Marseille-P2723]|uniref:DUF2948 family protein n=1 Tax=Chelativorans sp. Marseille-P2723 TaxID=2709133 RepID=UPI001570DD33|nr:DUF2948 family protein [Chelativorans sp. Marseille-P2723]
MDLLKLAALDEEDLAIVSAHVQDAVSKIGEMKFYRREKRFAMTVRRFVWEREQKRGRFLRRRTHERRLSAIQFDRVLAVRSTGIDVNKPEEVLSLLAIRFIPGDAPSGVVELAFAAGATLHLDVECIEARLCDLGAAWETPVRPHHSTKDLD